VVQPIVPDDDDLLYRRLVPDHLYPDGAVKSNAYKLNGKPDPSVSVDLEKLTNVKESLQRSRRGDALLGVIKVREVRALGLTVRHDPTDENPAHAIIEGNTTKTTCEQLAKLTMPLQG
jgi:hypothetical protein